MIPLLGADKLKHRSQDRETVQSLLTRQAEGMQVGCAKVDELSDILGVKSAVLGEGKSK